MILGVSITEWIGYLASLMVALSFTMKKVTKLRLVNSAGAVCFVIYGVLLKTAYPVIITNVIILLVNGYYLLKRISKK